MISRLSHATIYVLDQDKAKQVYTEKLGFEVDMDIKMDGGFRWLTVRAKDQPDLRIVLYGVQPGGNLSDDTVAHLRALLAEHQLGAGVFETSDCQKTYDELTAKGIEFLSPPQKQFYGIEAIFRDGCGNWFSLTQRTEA